MPSITCSVEDCSNAEKLSRGLCYTHYRRARRRGDFGLCAAASCDRGRDRGDYCNTHYMRVLRGHAMETPLKVISTDGLKDDIKYGRNEPALEKIRNRCTITESGCWEYPGRSHKGYGALSVDGKYRIAHRLTASLTKPNFTHHMQVHHACANRACCNPDHLRVVTAHENTAEMMERNYYLKRISELESALLSINPEHPLLTT